VAMGWSPSGMMSVADSVVGWVVDSTGDVYAGAYDNYAEGVTPQQSSYFQITDIGGNQVNGTTTIFFTRNFSSGINPIDPTGPNVVIGSYSLTNDYLVYHDGHTLNKISINFYTGEASVSTVISLFDIHGILMFIAWGVLLPLGMLFARYFRHLPSSLWFKVHRIVQPSGYVVALAGLIIAFIMVGAAQFTTPWHGQLGLTIMIGGFFQILIAVFRPHTDPTEKVPSTIRQAFEYSHWWLGRILIILGVINVFEGIATIGEIGGGIWITVAYPIFGAWIGILVVAVISREIQNLISPIPTITPLFKVYKKEGQETKEDEEMNDNEYNFLVFFRFLSFLLVHLKQWCNSRNRGN